MNLIALESLLFRVESLTKYASPQEKPYEHKYRARKLLEEALIQYPEQSHIIEYYLGMNYIDTEENTQASKHLAKSLELFSKSQQFQPEYIHALYNHMGYLALNQEQNQIGLAILHKALTLGEWLESQPKKNYTFRYQGLNQESLTVTLFYMAQAYAKTGVKDKSAYYCGQTMLRQYQHKTYELKDFCVNCISLAEYYTEQGHISQAVYLLHVAESIIPVDKKHKLRATIQMSLGKTLSEYLQQVVGRIKGGDITFNVNQQILDFKIEKVPFINFKCVNYDDTKSIFRQANTLYKKALKHFVLDGCVTEHIQIQQEISQMYKQLSLLDSEPINVIALLEKRIDLLQPLQNDINPKAYQNIYEKLLVEVSETSLAIYDLIFTINNIDDLQFKNKALNEKMNKYANLTITGYTQILKQLDLVSDKDQAYYQSVITAKFNIAKALSKLSFKDKKQKVDSLVKSLNTYRQLITYIDSIKEFKFEQEYQICVEMISLLPTKIDKINYS